MVDESKIGLVIKRAKALIQGVRERQLKHREAVRRQKEDNGPFAGGGPVLDDYNTERNALEDAIEQYEEETGIEHIPFKAEIRGDGVHEEIREVHESYGQLNFSRTHGGQGATHLFGSHVEYHPVTIRLEISRAERQFNKDLSSEHIYGQERLIEVEMSASQFADSITLMNQGQGIPCTIRYVGGVRMEDVPDEHRSEQHMIVDGFKRKMADVRKSVKPDLKKLEAILAKRSIGKKDREEITWLFEKFTRSFSDNAAFTVEQFNEATDKLTTEAKKEVESYMHSILVEAGIEHLKGAPQAGVLTSDERSVLEVGEDG